MSLSPAAKRRLTALIIDAGWLGGAYLVFAAGRLSMAPFSLGHWGAAVLLAVAGLLVLRPLGRAEARWRSRGRPWLVVLGPTPKRRGA